MSFTTPLLNADPEPYGVAGLDVVSGAETLME